MKDQEQSCSMGQWVVSLVASAICCLVLFAIFAGYVNRIQDSLTEQTVRMDTIQQRLIQTENQLTDLQRALSGGAPVASGDAAADAAAAAATANADPSVPAPALPGADMPATGAVPTTVPAAPAMPAAPAVPAAPAMPATTPTTP